jgi:RNA polymerase sigma factor (sigma-70 family)
MSKAPIPPRGRTTDPHLLERVRDWQDGEAWTRFMDHYQPRLLEVCRSYGLTGDAADECSQLVWVHLATTMQTFHYDPGRRFGAWLRVFFHCRVKDVLRSWRRRSREEIVSDDLLCLTAEPDLDWDEPRDPAVLALVRRAEVVQEAVRARVAAQSWEVFRNIAIEGRPVAEVARSFGKSYTTVYRSYTRVCRMVEEERRRQDDHG